MLHDERTVALQQDHADARSSTYGNTSLHNSVEFTSHSDWTENENETSDVTLPSGVSKFLSSFESKDLSVSVETFDETSDVSIEIPRHPDNCSNLPLSTDVTSIDGSDLFAECWKNSTPFNSGIPSNIAAGWIPSDISDICSASTSKFGVVISEKEEVKQAQELSSENEPPMRISSLVRGKKIHRLGRTSLRRQNLPFDILQSPSERNTFGNIQVGRGDEEKDKFCLDYVYDEVERASDGKMGQAVAHPAKL
uniref:uncharacterized protein n=1 Tax=Myxine glutinosa TaxID=7769 RepID=UPI00358F13AC